MVKICSDQEARPLANKESTVPTLFFGDDIEGVIKKLETKEKLSETMSERSLHSKGKTPYRYQRKSYPYRSQNMSHLKRKFKNFFRTRGIGKSATACAPRCSVLDQTHEFEQTDEQTQKHAIGPDKVNFGGRIKSFLNQRRKISNDPFLVKKKMIKGVELGFTDDPFQKRIIFPYKFDDKDRKLISAEISKFREQGIVQSALASFDQIVSTFFTDLKNLVKSELSLI